MEYLYAVVRAGHPAPSCTGVGAPPAEVTLVTSGPLAAVRSTVPDDLVVRDDDARAHLDVLLELLRGGPVVPIRMGTVAPDEDAVRTEVLDAARDGLAERLDSLDGLVEVHVDVDDDESEAVAAVVGGAGLADPAADLAGRLELGRQVADLLVERRQQIADEIVAQLRPFAVDDAPRATIQGPEDPVLRWAFLVRSDEIDRFDGAVAALRSQYPTSELRYVGPLPPSHFVDQPGPTPIDSHDSFGATNRWGW